MKTVQLMKHSVLGLMLLGGLTGCGQTHKKPLQAEAVSCSVREQAQLAPAIADAKTALSHRSCHYQFDTLHEQLLAVAKNDPDKTHNTAFLGFYTWSVKQGIINKRQGKELYTRYFKTSFGYVLSNDRNVCGTASIKDEMIKKIGAELAYKKIGLQDIMQDRKAFFEAGQVHNDLVFLLEATLLACENG